jgi:hypothetical protein
MPTEEEKNNDRAFKQAKEALMLEMISERMTYDAVVFLLKRDKQRDRNLLGRLIDIGIYLKRYDYKKVINLINKTIKEIPKGHKKYSNNYSAMAINLFELRDIVEDVSIGNDTKLREKYNAMFLNTAVE